MFKTGSRLFSPFLLSSSRRLLSFNTRICFIKPAFTRSLTILPTAPVKMAPQLYTDETPAEVKNAKGLHLITMNTPNGQAVQIMLEELKEAGYKVDWSTTLIVSSNHHSPTKLQR